MDAEVAALVGTGASALVELMLTDVWNQAKVVTSRLFRSERAGVTPKAVEDDLEASRAEILAAEQSGDNNRRDELAVEWKSRIRRQIERDPSSVDALRELVELSQSSSTRNVVTNNLSATTRGKGRTYQQGSGVQNNY